MDNLSTHMRITAVSVSDDDVDSRRAAASSLATSWGKETNVATLIRRAGEVAIALGGSGVPPEQLGTEVQAAIQKKASSYLYEERPFDVGVCAAMAMVGMLEKEPGTSGWSNKDIYAAALWLALSYQPVLEDVRRERLRQEVMSVAERWSIASANKARSRVEVKDPLELKITLGEGNAISHNFTKAISETIDGLRRNAALDREELDFLWWVQGGASRIVGRQISSLSEPAGVIVTAIEAATLLRRFPCDVHREIVLRTLVTNPELDLKELLGALGDHQQALGASFVDGHVVSYPAVFPFLAALAGGDLAEQSHPVKRSLSEWGSRALWEAGFIAVCKHGSRSV